MVDAETLRLLRTVRGDGRAEPWTILCPTCNARVPYVANLGQIGLHPFQEKVCASAFRELDGAQDLYEALPRLVKNGAENA